MDTEMKGNLRNDFFEKHPIYKQFLDAVQDTKFGVTLISMPRYHGRTMFLKRILRELQKRQNKNDDYADAAQYLGAPTSATPKKTKPTHRTQPEN